MMAQMNKLDKHFLVFFALFVSNDLCVSAVRLNDVDSQGIKELVDGNQLVIVLFYSDNNCRACEKAKMQFLAVGKEYDDVLDVVLTTAEVNVDAHDLAEDLSDLPVVKYFYSPDGTGEYTGAMTSTDLQRWINSVRNDVRELRMAPKSSERGAREIDASEFSLVHTPGKYVMVALYSPGCGAECDVFDSVADIFKDEEKVSLVKIDITKNPELANQFRVVRNPTLVWFPVDDKKSGKIFGSPAELEVLVEFFNDKTGTVRDYHGYIKDGAGRIRELDDIVQDHISDIIHGTRINSVIQQIRTVETNMGFAQSNVLPYLEILKDIDKGKPAEIVFKEKSEIVTQVLSMTSTDKKKEQEFTKLRNVLNFFVDMAAQKVRDDRLRETTTFKQPKAPLVIHSHDEL